MSRSGSPSISTGSSRLSPSNKFLVAPTIPVTPWKTCCLELGFPYVRKGTPQYEKVMNIYRARYPLTEVKEEELSPEQAKSRLQWKLSCAALGHKFVTKGTTEYDQVMEHFSHAMEKENTTSLIWAESAKELGYDPKSALLTKGSEDHQKVLALYRQKKEKVSPTDPKLKLWKQCCAFLGFEMVAKGTPEYEQVKAMFKSVADVQLKDPQAHPSTPVNEGAVDMVYVTSS